ncbi:MAG: ribosome maturation factor RimM [bacterium]
MTSGFGASTRIVLGEIVGSHGLRGEIRVRFTGDSPELLLSSEAVWIGRHAGDPEARRFAVRATGSGRQGEVRLALEGFSDREAVGPLVGQVVSVPAGSLPPLPEGEFYWFELVGCRVESETGSELGRVRELWETGAHDVLVVVDEEGRRRLIPTAAELMLRVDLAAGRIVVADLPGLLEPC